MEGPVLPFTTRVCLTYPNGTELKFDLSPDKASELALKLHAQSSRQSQERVAGDQRQRQEQLQEQRNQQEALQGRLGPHQPPEREHPTLPPARAYWIASSDGQPAVRSARATQPKKMYSCWSTAEMDCKDKWRVLLRASQFNWAKARGDKLTPARKRLMDKLRMMMFDPTPSVDGVGL